jgi:hypothetical protein
LLSKHRALVVYYFNNSNGTRYIAGTVLAIGDSGFQMVDAGFSNWDRHFTARL